MWDTGQWVHADEARLTRVRCHRGPQGVTNLTLSEAATYLRPEVASVRKYVLYSECSMIDTGGLIRGVATAQVTMTRLKYSALPALRLAAMS